MGSFFGVPIGLALILHNSKKGFSKDNVAVLIYWYSGTP